MGSNTLPSFTEHAPATEALEEAVRADQKMALLAQAFQLEIDAHDADQGAGWPMAQTIWFAVAVSGALWMVIVTAIRLI